MVRNARRPGKDEVAEGILQMLRSTDRITSISGFDIPGRFGVSDRVALAALQLLLNQRLIRADDRPHFRNPTLFRRYRLTEEGRGA